MAKKYYVLWEISVTVRHLIKKASLVLLIFKKSTAFPEAEQKMYASFRRVCGLRYITVSELLETMHENYLVNVSRIS